MNRRGFLTGTALAAATSLLPKATIFLPPAGGWPTRFKATERYAYQTYSLGFAIGHGYDQDYYAVLGAAYARALRNAMSETYDRILTNMLDEALGQ